MSIRVTGWGSSTADALEDVPELAGTLRRADEFIRLAVTIGFQVLEKREEQNTFLRESCGVFLGSSFGPMETNFHVLDQVINGEHVSPIQFSHSVFNGAAGYMATSLGMKGAAITMTDFSFPFFQALRQGYIALKQNKLQSCLVLQVESYSNLLTDVKDALFFESGEWTPGVACWLLEKNTAEAGKLQIGSVGIDTTETTAPGEVADFQEEVLRSGNSTCGNDPLFSATQLTELLSTINTGVAEKVYINGSRGRVKMSFSVIE